MAFSLLSQNVSDFSALLRRAKEGQPDALEALLEPHWDAVYRLSYRMTGHVEDAEDLAQEAFVRIIRRLPSFRGECAFGTWVYRVAVNVCLSDRRKSKRPTVELETLSVADVGPGPEARVLQHSFQERVREEILNLHPPYREVLLLRLIEELPYPEIAAILNVSVKIAQLKFHRGMVRLRERLKPWMDEGAL